MVHQELVVLTERTVLQVLLDLVVQMVHQELVVLTEQMVHQEQAVLQV